MVKKIRQEKPLKSIEDVKENAPAAQGKVARALASVHPQTREKGLRALTLWLSKRQDITDKDMLRLWKALFFCFWHSDLVPVQNALAERLSAIVITLPDNVSKLYFQAFVQTMRREWFKIDQHRMDKFLMLVRKFYVAHILRLQRGGWNTKEIKAAGAFWLKEVLLPEDTLVASGFAYHIADLFFVELSEVCKKDDTAPEESETAETVENDRVPSGKAIHGLIEPFGIALARTRDRSMIRRLQQGVFEPIARALQQSTRCDYLSNLSAKKLGDRLFMLGALKETHAVNREALYHSSKLMERCEEKGAKKDVAAMARGLAQDGLQEKTPLAIDVTAKKDAQSGASKLKKRKEISPLCANEPLENASDESAKKPKLKQKVASSTGDKLKATKNLSQTRRDSSAPLSNDDAAQNHSLASLDIKKKIFPKKKNKQDLRSSDAAEPLASTPGQGADEEDGMMSTPVRNGNIDGDLLRNPCLTEFPVAKSKSVRFGLKRNLVNYIGQPPLPEDVRTPPNCKPKGSALKQKSKFATDAVNRLDIANVDGGLESAPGRMQRQERSKRSRLANGMVELSADETNARISPIVTRSRRSVKEGVKDNLKTSARKAKNNSDNSLQDARDGSGLVQTMLKG